MGARVHLLRALIAPAAFLPCACVDFVEPSIPELGAAAVLQVEVRVLEDGELQLQATLDPGLDSAGFRRRVTDPALRFDGLRFEATDTLAGGALVWNVTTQLDDSEGPFSFIAPEIAGARAQPPGLTFAGLRFIEPDTVLALPGQDLVLPIATSSGDDSAARRQWRLTVRGDSTLFLIGADGPPPDSILVPARYLPAGDTLDALLLWTVGARVEPPPGDYVALVNGDTRARWTVIVEDSLP